MKIIKKVFKLFFILFIILIIFILGLYVVAFFSPSISLNSANSYLYYDTNDVLITQGSFNSNWISINDIDENVKNYIVNTEDQYFYYHKGFDILRIIKVLFNTIKNQNISAGASSISQQYVKNLFLTFDKTWKRKIQEAYLTIRLETHYSKNQILEGYLNTIYFGNGIYGIGNASLFYFNKDINTISKEEAIILTGIPKNPNNYNPISNWEKCLKRANIVAKNLLENDILTKNEYNNLNFNNIKLYGKENEDYLNTLMYYKDAVIDELYSIDSIPNNLISSGGLRIYTNFNLDTQKILENSIKEHTDDDNNQVASIVVEPATGKVIALAGGKDYSVSEYNRVTKAKRQVGSTIKPFLYYGALTAGMTEASTFKSEETTFVFAENKTYSPANYGNKYANKDISMAAALAYSDNIYAVKTQLFLGSDMLVNNLKLCGLNENLKANPSLALGAAEVSMLDYAEAYSTLASGGYHNDLYFITRVEDMNGNVLYKHENNSELVLNQSYTYIINQMMKNTYNYDFIDYSSPTVLYLNGKLDREYALKSGTTDNDYWIVGYNNDVLMMVWAGNDYNYDVPSTYSRNIKDIWLDTVSNYENGKENNWYNLPDNVVAVPMNPISGKYDINSNTLFYFIDGTQYAYIN